MKYSKEEIKRKVNEYYKKETGKEFNYPIVWEEQDDAIASVVYNEKTGEVINMIIGHISLNSYEQDIDGVICHELAHILEFERYRESDHGKRFFGIFYSIYPHLGI